VESLRSQQTFVSQPNSKPLMSEAPRVHCHLSCIMLVTCSQGPLVPILGQINSLETVTRYLTSILILQSHPSIGLHHIIRAATPAHLSLVITLWSLRARYNAVFSSLASFLPLTPKYSPRIQVQNDYYLRFPQSIHLSSCNSPSATNVLFCPSKITKYRASLLSCPWIQQLHRT
jgi:hypothetical protein